MPETPTGAPTGEKQDADRIEWSAHGLKCPSLPVFSEDQRKYEDWKNTFDAFVGNEKIPDKFKIIQLRTCLAGDPLKMVERYSPNEAGYSKVRNEGITGKLVRSAVRRLHLHFLTLFDILNPKMIHVAEMSCQIRLS